MTTAHSNREDELFSRPPPEAIQSEWTSLFSDPLLSLPRLKSTALSKAGLGQSSADGGIILRSVYWRFYHGLLPTPTSLDLFPPHLESTRSAYSSLRRRYLIAPDGRWAADCSGSEEYDPSSQAGPSRINSGAEWDPLSLDGGSPWKAWFAHLDLRVTIRQDVERTFPDMPYFGIERVTRSLVTMLFLFAVLNPDVGYRQGMHELLAVCFLAVDRDSLESSGSTPLSPLAENRGMKEAMTATLDRRYIEQDAFGLFQEVMRGAKPFYEWRAEEGPRTKTIATLPAPIITQCNHIHNGLLRRVDPQLWERLETEGVEAQIWAIRWLRLIFTRELPFTLAMRIWDGVFAEDPGLGILDFVCIAMLLLIRNELLDADYPTLLTHLLHYPAPSATFPFCPPLILSQAQFLRDNISPASGVHVVIQNQELLGVKAQPPERDEPVPMRGRVGPALTSSMRGNVPRGGTQGMQGVQGLAAGLFERAQAAGLDRAIMSTVTDFRKNLPDSAAAYAYLPKPFSPTLSPAARDAAAPFSSIPNSAFFPFRSPNLTSSSPTSTRPPMQARVSLDSNASIKSVKDAEREVAELRLAMVGMGKAMGEWLTSLAGQSEQACQQVSAREGLERVRDTLLDAAGKGVDEIVKEWGWHEGLEAPRSRDSTPNPLTAPEAALPNQPLPVPDEVVFDAEEITPTMPSFPVLEKPPQLPVNPAIMQSAPLQSHASGSKPPLYLSSRHDKPIATLPRVPMTAPVQSQSISNSTALWPSRAASSISRRPVKREDEDGTEANLNGDPLAGVGVSALKADETRRRTAVDPLLGVGVR